MLDFVETILVKIFSLLPNSSANSAVLNSVNSAFALLTPAVAKIDLIFPIFVLFKIMLLVLFIELTLFLLSLVFKVAGFFKL
jgi:hypothetical protein